MIGIIARLRQWVLPSEFRIRAAPSSEKLSQSLTELAAALENAARKREPACADEPALLDLANRVWELDCKLRDPNTREPRTGLHREVRLVARALNALSSAGIVVQDHTGKRFYDGDSLEPEKITVPGIAHPRIRQTLRPSIYINKRHVQQGRVIVEVPESAETPPGAQNPAAERLVLSESGRAGNED